MRIETVLSRLSGFKGFVFAQCQMKGRTHLVFSIRARRGSKGICSGCGQRAPGYDRLPVRWFEFIPFWGLRCFLAYALRRLACPDCGVRVERVPWSDGKSPATTHYQAFLASWAKLVSWKTVAEKFRTSWDTVSRSVAAVVAFGLAERRLAGVEAIGIDELAWRKGHHYVTLVWQLDGAVRRLLWVGQKRTRDTLRKFFDDLEKLQEGFGAGLRFVCSDMWKPYLRVAHERAGQALHLLDRFHVMQKFSKVIDKVRAAEARRLKKAGQAPVLKHTRWCFLKRPSNLTHKERFRLRDLLKMNLPIIRAYLLKEQFQCFWEYVSPTWAGKFLDTWCDKANRSRIPGLRAIVKTLQGHRELLLNWFRAKKQFNNSIVEGLNYKVNITVRRAFGYRSFAVFEVALYHQFGNLPEPEFTHPFW